MALSRELTRRLQVEDEPLAKRLKLAENAFTSTDLPVTRKEDLVLKWLCGTVKNDSPEDDLVWSTLNRCLKYKTLSVDNVLKSEIKESLIRTLIDKLSRVGDKQLENVLRCCELVFSTCEMQNYFQSKPACLVKLMKALFRTVSDSCKNENSRTDISAVAQDASAGDPNSQMSSGRRCAASAVECFVACYKQSLNKDEFVDLLLLEIIYPMCGFIDRTGSDRLGAEIHKCIQQIIFGKSRYSQFRSFDSKDNENFVTKVFARLKENVANKADPEISVVVFLYIFRAAVGSYKNDPSVIDVIFRNVIDSAGGVKIQLFGCMSEQLTNITFDYQNKIGDTTLFEYLQKIMDDVLSMKRLGSEEFDALAGIAVLNPLIIETKLQSVLKKILLENKKTSREFDSYEKLMIGILDAEVRLRREQKLVPWIITAIRETMNERENSNIDMDAIFPEKFKERFTKTVTSMTSMQMIGVFRSLTFHLNALSNESVDGIKNDLTFMLRVNVDLMTAFFRGVRIFDHSVPITGQEKFALALDDLGKTLGLLTKIILNSKKNDKTVTPLMTLAWYWDNMYNWLKYYAPDAITKTLEFPIAQDRMNVLIDGSIDNSENTKSINRILVQKIGRDCKEGTSLNLSTLSGGFEKFWSIIVEQNPRLITLMNNSEIVETARLLLEDVRTSGSTEKMSVESIQNDERMVKALVCQTFADMGSKLDRSTTKIILEHVNPVKILNRGKVSKILKEIKKELAKNEWTIIDEETASVIERNLKILLLLPLPHLPLDLRTLVLLVAHTVAKECEENVTVCESCTKIILDVTERSDVDIIDYVDAESLIHDLPRNIGMQRAVESSLRKISSWETLKELIKQSKIDDESVAVLLECVEKTRTKSSLTNDQKAFLKKAERKLSKKLLDSVETEVKDHREVKRLSMALTVVAADAEIPENLSNLTKTTLDRIFLSKVAQDEKLIAEGLQLVSVVLKKRSKFEMSQEVVENVWPLVIKNPSKELAGSLLQTTQAKALNRILQLLHKQTISGLDESDETSFAKALIMWDSVTNAPMKAARDKCRIAAIVNVLEALQISKIPSKSWPDVLRLVQTIFARHSHAIERGIDVILLLAARSLREVGLSACDDVLEICFLLTKFKIEFIVDRLPVLLALYRQLVGLVVRESRKKLDSTDERKLRCLALDIAKFTNSLIKLKKELARISPYVIADLVEMFSEGVIPSCVKGPIEDSVGHFLSICDNHAVSLLSRALPAATQEIFKKLYETYNKFYKYTGKI